MPLEFFAIAAHGDPDGATVLNQFLGSHRIVAVDRQLVQDGQNSFWAIAVSHLATAEGRTATPRRDKIDYREILPEAQFALYARLRLLRKELADRDAVPAAAMLAAVREFASDRLQLTVKRSTEIGRSNKGMNYCGFRVLPGVLLLSRRRRRRYSARRTAWERSYSVGAIDALGLQAGYASALAITSHANAAGWRREQLRRVPVQPSVSDI